MRSGNTNSVTQWQQTNLSCLQQSLCSILKGDSFGRISLWCQYRGRTCTQIENTSNLSLHKSNEHWQVAEEWTFSTLEINCQQSKELKISICGLFLIPVLLSQLFYCLGKSKSFTSIAALMLRLDTAGEAERGPPWKALNPETYSYLVCLAPIGELPFSSCLYLTWRQAHSLATVLSPSWKHGICKHK